GWGERGGQRKGGGRGRGGGELMAVARGLAAGHEIPEEAPEAVVQDVAGARRPPSVVGSGPVESAAEEGVEAADVVHVQVREEQVVDQLDLPEGELPQAAVAAVEQEAAHGLAAVDGHQQGAVPA